VHRRYIARWSTANEPNGAIFFVECNEICSYIDAVLQTFRTSTAAELAGTVQIFRTVAPRAITGGTNIYTMKELTVCSSARIITTKWLLEKATTVTVSLSIVECEIFWCALCYFFCTACCFRRILPCELELLKLVFSNVSYQLTYCNFIRLVSSSLSSGCLECLNPKKMAIISGVTVLLLRFHPIQLVCLDK